MKKAFLAIVVIGFLLLCARAQSSSVERHVIVMVWDGMRPDFISETNTPNLFALATRGVRFANHHPVYISTTEVNGTTIATGTYPGMDGILANTEYRPLIEPEKPIHTEEFEDVRKGDEVAHGHYVAVPTTAEILQKHGYHTIITAAKPVGLLHDRLPRTDSSLGINIFAGRALPDSYGTIISNFCGVFPEASAKSPTRNDWTTDALIHPLWKNGVPAFNVLWMSEPDASQHATGPGSPRSLAAIREADRNLGRVVQRLTELGKLDTTDIMVVSDHGFTTIQAVVDVAESLRNAGFKAFESFAIPPNPGDIMVVPLGGSFLLYVTGHDPVITEKLVDFLQHWQSTGVIFTRTAMPGTFSMAMAHIDSKDKPDLIVSLRWNDGISDFGAPGMLDCCAVSYHPGQGMHGSLSRSDMHNTFVAAGPDFKTGIQDQLPTGNIDIAPTALHLLGVTVPETMRGRVVSEALVQPGLRSLRSYAPNRVEAVRSFGKSTWKQYLLTSTVNGTLYLDQGNGELKSPQNE